MSSPSAAIKRSTLLVFVLPTLCMGFMHGPEGLIQGIYAKYAGISLGALAGAVLLTRMFDAITYPLIGHLSDRSFARSGTRRYWIMGGALLSTLGVWFLFRPPPQVTVVYYTAWMSVTYLGWKVAEIPYQAWSYGLSDDYAQRARVQGWRYLAQILGAVLFFASPALAVQLGISNSTEVDLAALGVAAVISAFLVPVTTAIALWRVPEGIAAPPSAEQKKHGVLESLRSVFANTAMARLLLALAPFSFLTGMAGGVFYLFVTTYLGLAKEYSTIALTGAPMTLIGVPLWTWLSMRFERHHVLAVSMLSCAVAYAGMALLEPGPGAYVPILLLYPVIMVCLLGIIIAFTMTADAADFGKLQSAEDHSGLYASALMFVVKSLTSVSAAAGLALVGWFGFDATAAVQTPDGVFGMKLAAVYLPAVGLGLVGVVIWGYPLNKARLMEIRAQLAERARTN